MTHHVHVATATMMAIVASATLLAQTPMPRTPPPGAPAATRTVKTVTLTGCLKAWDGATPAAGATAKPAAALDPSAARYVLTNVAADATATTTNTQAAPVAPPQSQPKPTSKNYVVKSDAALKLGAHVNHTVELTGTLSDEAEGVRPGPDRPPTPGQPDREQETAVPALDTLTAQSVKMVSATCGS